MIQKLGKYTIVAKLGEGAMGAVYKAYDQILDRHVAIKTMAEDIKWDPELKLRFYREARSAASLHHPNIVTIHDLGEEGKITYIVMELLEGKELKQLVQEKVELPLEKRLSIMMQVSEGLNHAHLHGIIHRDIKPGNIHLTPSGTVKILDFGIARIPSSDLTRSGVRLGTPIYMSPEQIRGGDYDERSDIFSAGIVFYELLTYVHPFRDRNIAKTLDNILFQTQLPFAEQFPDAPPGLWPILNNCLAKEPGKRYASMAELGRACRNLASELTEAVIGMTRDLQSVLPRLRQAAGRSGAAEDLTVLARDAEALLGGDEKPDYLALQRLMKNLSAQSAVLQQTPSPAQDRAVVPSTPPRAEREAGPSEPSAPAEATSHEPPIPSDTSASVHASPPQPTAEQIRGRELLSSGKAFMEEGRLDQALETLRQAMGLLGPKEEVVSALARTRQLIDEQKKKRLTGLLESAREALSNKSFADAVHHADEILTLEASHTEAVEIRRQAASELEAERAKKARQEAGEREKAAGLKLLAESKCRDSLIALRRAAELLGEDSSIRAAIAQAEEGIHLEEIRAQVEAELTEARKLLQLESFDKALSRVHRALEISPGQPDAAELLKTIEAAKESKVREKGEAEKTAGFKLLADKKFRESLLALRRASQLLGEDPAVQLGIEEAEEGIRNDELRLRVQTELEEARRLLQSDQFSEAREHAQQALELAPKAPEPRELLNSIEAAREEKRRGQEITLLLKRGQGSFSSGSYDESEQYSREVLLIDPDNKAASELLGRVAQARQQIARQEQIERLLQQGREGLSQGKLREAAMFAREILALDRQNPAAQDLLGSVEAAEQKAKTQEQVAQLLEQSKTALGRENLGEALTQAREALRMDPDNAAAAQIVQEVEATQEERRRQQIASLLTKGRQALGREDFRDASIRAQEILLLDPKNAEASSLLRGIEDARQKQLRDKIAGLLFECQKAREQGNFEDASSLAGQVIEMDPSNRDAKTLSKQIANDIKARNKELKKQEKAAAREAAQKTVISDSLGKTVILDQSMAARRLLSPKVLWISGGVAALVLLIVAGVLWLPSNGTESTTDQPTKLASAQQLMKDANYDQAIVLLEEILRESPDDGEAGSLLSAARTSRDAIVVERLMIEAGSLRSEGKPQEALDTILRVLERDPKHEQALVLRGQLEAELHASKSQEEQEKEVQAWLTKVPELLRTGRFEEAGAELQKILQIRPGDPQAVRLRRQLDRSIAAAKKTEDDKVASTDREQRSIEMSRQVTELIRRGRYEEAQTLLGRWADEAPQDPRYRDLQNRNSELIRHHRGYERLMSERRYADALDEVQQLEKLNSSDPNLAAYRSRAEERKASATAVLTVLRLGDAAQFINLDDQQVSTSGELEGKTIAAGMHKLTVRGSRWQGEISMDFLDGQNYSYVYDLSRQILRPMSSEDREAASRRKESERTLHWKVQHEHGGLFSGSCDGEIFINGFQVEYRPEKENAHRDVLPFQALKLKIDGDKIEFIDARGNRRWQKFKVVDSNQVKTIKQIWDRLEKIAR